MQHHDFLVDAVAGCPPLDPTAAAARQVLHYADGQRYEQHHDFLVDAINPSPEHGGQRLVTFLMYLTTVEEGGETVFPMARITSGVSWLSDAM